MTSVIPCVSKNQVLYSMILILSNDNAFAENLSELLSIEGARHIVTREGQVLLEKELLEGIDFIIYHDTWDPIGEKFDWYLLANQLQDIPVIFLTLKENLSKNENHIYLELPFELNALSNAIDDCMAMSRI